MTTTYLDGVSETTVSPTFTVQDASLEHRDAYVLAQVEITDTATVQIQGRLSDDYSWVSLTEEDITANGVFQVIACPQMRFEVTAYTSGTITAGVR